MEKTLSMIKPEAVGRGLSGKIIAAIEESGLKVVAQKMLRLSREQAARFYAVHQNKAFFDELIRKHHCRTGHRPGAGRRKRN